MSEAGDLEVTAASLDESVRLRFADGDTEATLVLYVAANRVL